MSKKTKIIIGVLVVAAIAATVYYFKVYKPKQAASATTEAKPVTVATSAPQTTATATTTATK